jgi:hypothetical protein
LGRAFALPLLVAACMGWCLLQDLLEDPSDTIASGQQGSTSVEQTSGMSTVPATSVLRPPRFRWMD